MCPRYSKDPRVEQSLRHSVKDGVATSAMIGGGESYFSAYALHLHATTTEVGILATLPVMFGALAQLFSVLLGRRLARRRTLILTGVGLQAAAWLPLALLPLLFAQSALPLLLFCLIFYFAAGHLITPSWSCLMGDLVPERKRGRFFAHRTRCSSLTAFATLVVAGALLHHFDGAGRATAGFLAIFALAAVARLFSLRELALMHEPAPDAQADMASPAEALARLPRSAFARFSLFFALMQAAVGVAGPFFAVYMLRDLGLSYLQYTVLAASSVLLQVVSLGMWGRVADAFGNRLVLLGTGVLMPVVPALWLFDPCLAYLIAIQALAGLVWSGFTLAAGNICYDLSPARLRATWMAAHNLLAHLGLFLGALTGGWLSRELSRTLTVGEWRLHFAGTLLVVFLISALLRLVVVALFLPGLREARRVRPVTLRRLAFRVTRMRWTLRGRRGGWPALSHVLRGTGRHVRLEQPRPSQRPCQ